MTATWTEAPVDYRPQAIEDGGMAGSGTTFASPDTVEPPTSPELTEQDAQIPHYRYPVGWRKLRYGYEVTEWVDLTPKQDEFLFQLLQLCPLVRRTIEPTMALGIIEGRTPATLVVNHDADGLHSLGARAIEVGKSYFWQQAADLLLEYGYDKGPNL